jgi:ribosomal protein S18 acetylase RimI-like enzyme
MDTWRVARLDNKEPEVAAAIHRVMFAAYSVEAELLGIADFLPLRRTVGQIVAAPTEFIGASVEGALAAVVELDLSELGRVSIDSLVTDPAYTRRGSATALLRHVTSKAVADRITVSTATGNEPALLLYSGQGFVQRSRWFTPDGIAMVTLRYQR